MVRNWTVNVFAEHDVTLSSTHRFHVACPCHSLHVKRDSSLEIDFYWYELCAHFPHGPLSIRGPCVDCHAGNPLILLDVDQHLSGVLLLLLGVDLPPPS